MWVLNVCKKKFLLIFSPNISTFGPSFPFSNIFHKNLNHFLFDKGMDLELLGDVPKFFIMLKYKQARIEAEGGLNGVVETQRFFSS